LENGDLQTWGVLLGWLFIHDLGRAVVAGDPASASWMNAAEVSRSWMDEWQLGNLTTGALQDLGLDEAAARQAVSIVKLVTGLPGLCAGTGPYHTLSSLLQDSEVQRFLGINRHQGVLWFNREAFRKLVWFYYAISVVETLASADEKDGKIAEALTACYAQVERLLDAEQSSGYQVEALLEAAKG
jgi:hypothetical protein